MSSPACADGGEPSAGDLAHAAEQFIAATAARYESHLSAGDIAAAIDVLDEVTAFLGGALERTVPASAGHVALCQMAATTCHERWLLTGDEASRQSLIRHARAGLSGCEQPDVAAELRYVLSWALADTDLDEAIALLNDVRAEAGTPLRQDAADVLGHLHCQRYFGALGRGDQADAADLDSGIELLAAAAERAISPSREQDGEGEVDLVRELVRALSTRYDLRSDQADRDDLIAWTTVLLEVPGPVDDDVAMMHEAAATALIDRAYDRPKTARADGEAAVVHLKRALGAAADDKDRAALTAMLAHAYWTQLSGDESDHRAVDEMVRYAEQAWRLLPVDEPARESVGLYLATGIYERFRRTGEAFDLVAADLAIDALTDILPGLESNRDSDSDAHGLYLTVVATFGVLLVSRAQFTRSVDDALAAQPMLLRAAEELPMHDPYWGEVTQSLAAAMTGLAGIGLSTTQIDRTIDLLAVACARPHADRVRLALTRTAYGVMLVQRAGFTGSGADLDGGIDQLQVAYGLAASDRSPDGAAIRLTVAWNLGSALLARFNERGDRQDLDAAERYAGTMTGLDAATMAAVRAGTPDYDVLAAGMPAMVAATRAAAGDAAMHDVAIEKFRAVLAILPPGHPHRPMMTSSLGMALAMRSGSPVAHADDLREAVCELTGAAREMPDGHLHKPLALLRAGGILAAQGQLLGNAGLLREGIGVLRDAVATLDPRFGDRARFAATLGMAHRWLGVIAGGETDLEIAARWLREACDELRDEPGHPVLVASLTELAQVYVLRGMAGQGIDAGLAALRERGRDVLLQTGTSRGLSRAAAAAAESAQLARVCLASGRHATAVEALERGRGLVLRAATVVAELPELLDHAGHAGLAREWHEAAIPASAQDPWDSMTGAAEFMSDLLAGTASLQMPSDLRARTLTALGGPGGERLLAVPGPDEIAAALARTGADALVYLLAPAGGSAGQAVIVRAVAAGEAVLDVIELPLLHDSAPGAVRDLAEAQRELLGSADGDRRATGPDAAEPVASRWRGALDAACDWAWMAAMRPVLAMTWNWQLGRPPRLVLVPTGTLSLVPWHAARRPLADPGQFRFACQDAVVSYAASGRQLIDVSRRAALPLGQAPVIVAEPGLPFAVLEGQAIRDASYPTAAYLGHAGRLWSGPVAGRGTAAEVLAQLPAAERPGASMLHLGCHANVVGGSPGRSFLQLADGSQLTVEQILRAAGGREPTAPGGLITLAACGSDLAAEEHDEALTLATAFLAAGSVTVVGARWDLPEGAISMLMFMFHHLMATEGHEPRDALRLAQLWMLDPDRQPPGSMPAALARDAGLAGLSDVSVWASVTHQGR